MTILLMSFLLGGFVQRWYIPQGLNSSAGRIVVSDTDRDGNYEFFIRTYGGSQKIYIYELHLPNVWEVDSFSYFWGPLVWDVGDFDLDGLYDLVIQTAVATPPSMLISVAESLDSFSYPTQEVWRDTVGFPMVTPICVYDIDQDGIPEIVKIIGDTTDFDIYECISDNLYIKIFRDTIPANHSPSSTVAFGDFDLDGQNEFVFGYTGGEYSIWECEGDNLYQEIILQQLSTLNIKDCFSVPDADGDGKLEFVVKGFIVPTARINAFVFEAIGDNTYAIIKTFDLFGGSNDYYGGYSEAGDVDGDSIPEIVLEGCQNIYIIKSAGNDSFYVWETLPGHTNGSCVRVYDIDSNGLSEIIISGNDETRIYEYEEGGIEEVSGTVKQTKVGAFPNPFQDKLNIKLQTSPDARIQLKIFDATGRLIKSFSQLNGQAVNQIIWDAKDENNRRLPDGIYFIQLETQDYKKTEKVILLK